MKILCLSLLVMSFNVFASQMGAEAIEMAAVMSHPQVKDCMRDISVGEMINVSIEKKVARCPMCNSYIISGNELIGGDVPNPGKTVIKLEGKGVPGIGFGFVQTFKCSIMQPR